MNNQPTMFEGIEPDYQITAMTEDIDLARILNENVKEGCEYVFIITNLTYAVFMTKRMANRIKKADLADVVLMADIEEEKNYGFVKINDGVHERNHTLGSTIRSIGFTAISSGYLKTYGVTKNLIDNIGSIEDSNEQERLKNAHRMNVVKIIAG